MAIALQCGCGKQMNVADNLAGKRIRCPQCQAVVAVPEEVLLIEEDASAYEVPGASVNQCPECQASVAQDAMVCVKCGHNFKTGQRLQTKVKKSAKRVMRADKLSQVRLGLAFHSARLIIFLATPVVVGIDLIIGLLAADGGQGGAVAGGILRLLVGLLLLAALLATPLLGIIGSVLCAWVPSKLAQSMVLVSLVLDLASLVIAIVLIALTMTGAVATAPTILEVLVFIQLGLLVAAWVLFMFFLQRLANDLEEWGHAHEAGTLLYFSAILVAFPLYLLVKFLVRRQTAANIVMALRWMVPVLLIVYLLCLFGIMKRQLELVGYLRGAIAKNLAGA